MTKETLKRIVAGFVATLALLTSIYFVRREADATKIRQHHASADGVITSKRVGDHGMVDYRFTADGKEYSGRGVGGAERAFGASVTVFYFPSDPAISSLHDPIVWKSPGWPPIVVPLAISCISFAFAVGWVKARSSSSRG